MATSLTHASQRRGWPVALSHRQAGGTGACKSANRDVILSFGVASGGRNDK